MDCLGFEGEIENDTRFFIPHLKCIYIQTNFGRTQYYILEKNKMGKRNDKL